MRIVKGQNEEKKAGGRGQARLQADSVSAKRRLAELVDSKEAASVLGRSANTLKRWRYEGIGPEYVDINGRPRYDLAVLQEFILANTRMPSVRAAMERNS